MLAAHWEGNPNVIYYKAKGTGGANEMAGALEDGEVMYGLGQMLLFICMLLVDFYSFRQCAMNVGFLKDGTNFWASIVQNSYTVTIQMKPLLLDWWTKIL